MSYYSQVLGPPAYVEDDFTRGWKLGDAWLTLFPSAEGAPKNMELQITIGSLAEAQALSDAFKEAGGTVEESAGLLMYEPLRIYPVKDTSGTNILILARLET